MVYNIRIFLICLCLAIPGLIFAKMPVDISHLDNLPRSISKDYYIYRFLNEQNISDSDAKKLLSQAKVINIKLFKTFAKKLDDKSFKKASLCMRLKTSELLKKDNDCIAIGLSVQNALSLDKKTLKSLSLRLKNYRDINKTLKVLATDDVFKASLRDKDSFITIFNASSKRQMNKIFNKKISKKDIEELSYKRGFNLTIKIILTQRTLKNLQRSLLHVKINPNLNADSLFFLGLNNLEVGNKKTALSLFDKAYEKYYYRFDKDKTLFWSYLITKDKKYIDKLSKSFDINVYTIFAKERKGEKFTNIISPQINAGKAEYNVQNPFLWLKLLRQIKDKNSTQIDNIAEKFKHSNTVGQYSFLQERAHGYKNGYFPMPFYNYLKDYSTKRVALILAIGRQESRFIPASISTSYALGMMQFMPFLAKYMAKEKKMKNFDLDDMFEPKIAYSFADAHLDYLNRYLHNPILIAYAYNGGIGFVRRFLKTGNFFAKGEYEPYLSMELIPYSQSRRYGKKVLANYVIYSQLLGDKVTLSDLFENLMTPASREKFGH